MNPYYYLFYKLSKFLNKKENNEWGSIYALTVLIGWNIVFIYINLFHITEKNSKGVFKVGLIATVIILFITNSILFLNKKRRKNIMNHYNSAPERNKKIGSYLVILYMVLTILSIFFA